MIQLEDIKKLTEYAKENGLQMGAEPSEIEKVIEALKLDEQNLTHSNDDEIDMIIAFVKDYTMNSELQKLLDTVDVANIRSAVSGGAYAEAKTQPYDKSKVKAGYDFLKTIRMFANIGSVMFNMEYYKIEHDRKTRLSDAYLTGILIFVNAIDTGKDIEYQECYLRLQYLIAEIDKELPYFSDHLVYFSREIYEMALAFIIGHEIGHHYCGHLEELKRLPGFYMPPEKRKQKEFEADNFGVEFALEYMRACLAKGNYLAHISGSVFERTDYRLLGIPFLFLTVQDEKAESDTHPSAYDRTQNVWNVLQSSGIEEKTVSRVKEYFAILKKSIADAREFMKNKSQLL